MEHEDPEVNKKLELWLEKKKAREFTECDALRDELKKIGVNPNAWLASGKRDGLGPKARPKQDPNAATEEGKPKGEQNAANEEKPAKEEANTPKEDEDTPKGE